MLLETSQSSGTAVWCKEWIYLINTAQDTRGSICEITCEVMPIWEADDFRLVGWKDGIIYWIKVSNVRCLDKYKTHTAVKAP